MTDNTNGELEKEKIFLERTKLFRDHIQGVLALATGSLVLSVTFLHDVGDRAVNKYDLKNAWIFFGLAILCGVAYNYVLTIYTQSQRSGFRSLLTVISSLLHALFLVGIFFLVRFGVFNVR